MFPPSYRSLACRPSALDGKKTDNEIGQAWLATTTRCMCNSGAKGSQYEGDDGGFRWNDLSLGRQNVIQQQRSTDCSGMQWVGWELASARVAEYATAGVA